MTGRTANKDSKKVQYSAKQHRKRQHSTVQCSAVQHSIFALLNASQYWCSIRSTHRSCVRTVAYVLYPALTARTAVYSMTPTVALLPGGEVAGTGRQNPTPVASTCYRCTFMSPIPLILDWGYASILLQHSATQHNKVQQSTLRNTVVHNSIGQCSTDALYRLDSGRCERHRPGQEQRVRVDCSSLSCVEIVHPALMCSQIRPIVSLVSIQNSLMMFYILTHTQLKCHLILFDCFTSSQ
jgi:hypothetical protein